MQLKKDWQIYEVLRDVRKPVAYDGPELDVEREESKLAKAEKLVDLLRTCTSHLDTVRDLLALTPAQRKLSASKKLPQYRERVSEIKSKMAVHRAVKDKVASQKERIAKLEHDLKEEEAVKVLVKGFSDKAIKRMAVEAISTRLMQLINHYAQSVFPGYMFDFQWDRQISIIVHRPNGEVSDVRKLSGAESMLFTLILIPALLAFMPAHKRTNVLILDEPSASFSEATMKTFHDLLPVLQKLVPSIIVITPKATERYPGAHEFTVHRTKDGATIKPGHPEVHV
jgi:DNA repair exonuclease SbcCD ATPase subunit